MTQESPPTINYAQPEHRPILPRMAGVMALIVGLPPLTESAVALVARWLADASFWAGLGHAYARGHLATAFLFLGYVIGGGLVLTSRWRLGRSILFVAVMVTIALGVMSGASRVMTARPDLTGIYLLRNGLRGMYQLAFPLPLWLLLNGPGTPRWLWKAA